MTNHSKLPPSSAARRMACPGSRAMEERYGRDDKSEASIEGDLAHELAALYLKGPTDHLTSYTLEMMEGAHLYKEIVKLFISDPHIEERVDISSIHPECWGTPDVWGITGNDIHVFDYKFGFTPVEAYENWQLLEYACGIYEANKTLTTIALQNFNIYLHIIQPRDFISGSKHKMWHLTGQEFESYRQRLVISEALAMTPNAPLIVSEQCKYCKARYACPALQEAALGAAEVAHRAPTQELTPKQLGTELKFLHEAQDLLNYRITAIEAEVEYHLRAGTRVDNYQLKNMTGRLNWKITTREVLELGLLLGVNMQKEEVMTPTQAINSGIKEEIVLKYAERKSSSKLSKIDTTKSREVFKK